MSNIDYTKHKDSRKNNPTIENRNFFVAEENKPYDALYPRDPSLDPQLVWKGKDELDREDLAVPTVPIYIQEKIQAAALIEDLRAGSGGRGTGSGSEAEQFSLDLYSDFNGIDSFDKEIEFYQHDKHWSNRMILGDSLLVMNSLAEKEGLKGKVQCIYLDPPYGIKFGSNWQVSTRKRDVKDGKAEDAAREPEVVRAFRDTWKLGIHSYLSYLRDRFRVAQELLTETGSIFVQIGDENVHLVRCVLDEVFGSENYCGQIAFVKTAGKAGALLDGVYDVLLWYAKDQSRVKFRSLFVEKRAGVGVGEEYKYLMSPEGLALSGKAVPAGEELKQRLESGWRLFRFDNLISQSGSETTTIPFGFMGKVYSPSSGGWKTNERGLRSLAMAKRIAQRNTFISYIRYVDDFPVSPVNNVWSDLRWGFDAADKRYVVETNPRVVQRCILMATDPGDLVLDPTCGSGTTAYVAEQWGRRWITIDTSRVALALARTRLMSAKFPYYLLADLPEGIKKEADLTGQIPPQYATSGDIKKGFVYKRVPHVTLKSIANNPDIEAIAATYDPQLEAKLAQVNESAKLHGIPGAPWSAQTVPQDRKKWKPDGTHTPHDLVAEILCQEYWALAKERRDAIDKAIAKHADTELLYDQPYEDNKRLRVTGPFTVESLSPHRVLPAESGELGVASGEPGLSPDELSRTGDFTQMVLDNLRKAGVQNTKKGERLLLPDLQPYAGRWIHARGTFTAGDGTTKRVAISVGPEYGAVSPMQVKEAAKEAVQGLGHDILVVCGYAFDPHVNEEVKQYGTLTVLPARMNADLLMADDLLKKTGAGNLFTVFGEPDLDVRPLTPDPSPRHSSGRGELVVELRGLDVYDPTTGEIRSDSTDDIACWFIDTNYNGEAFFVRHAYFTGADEPYEKLKKALRAEIDEGAWASIYSTVSRPFPVPESGKIAIKVINHYGDEVLKVYNVASSG